MRELPPGAGKRNARYGNQASLRLLQPAGQALQQPNRLAMGKCAGGAVAGPDGECSGCRAKRLDQPAQVYYEPEPGTPGQSDGGVEANPVGGPPAVSTPSPRCKVKSFGMKFDKWNISWPGSFFNNTTIRLPVDFSLELDSGCTRADCLIGQNKRGRVEHAGGTVAQKGMVVDEFSSWTADAPPSKRYWWDGAKWSAGAGSWGWFSESATFKDEPGFNSAPQSYYPLYWGGVGRKGHFEFETYIQDKATFQTVRKLTWGMLMDYSAPQSGRHYFYT